MAQSKLLTPDAAGKRTPTTDRLQVQLSENEEFLLPRMKISLSILRQFRAIKKITRHLGAIKIRQIRAMS